MKAVGLDEIQPYLHNQKEYWALRNSIQHKFLSSLSVEKTEPHQLKAQLKKILDKSGNEEKLKLLLQNSIYNYKTDNCVVDPELRNKFGDACLKWREYLSMRLDSFYGEAVLEMKRQKKLKDPNLGYVPVKIYDIDDMIKFFSKVRAKEQDKLVRFQLLYFQIPNMKTVRTIFKELNTEKFDHLNETDEEVYTEKEKACEEVIAEESDNFEYLNCFKFGIPPGIRYKFMLHYSTLGCHPTSTKSSASDKLDEPEAEAMRFWFKNDCHLVCNETSFFTFDETLLELSHKLVTDKEILFDSHETESDHIFNARMPNRIVPVTGFLKFMGILTYFNKKKEKIYLISKFLLKNHVSKMFDIRPVNSENIIGELHLTNRSLHNIRADLPPHDEQPIHLPPLPRDLPSRRCV